VTGTSGDTSIDGITKAWATIPYLDQTTGSGIGVQGVSSRAQGTFTLNGATPVAVAIAGIQATDGIIWWETVAGGTPSNPVFTITPGVGFSVVALAANTSTFGYKLAKG
jgi:hypothetical protein